MRLSTLNIEELKVLAKSFGIKSNKKKQMKQSLTYIYDWLYAGELHPDLKGNYTERIREVFNN